MYRVLVKCVLSASLAMCLAACGGGSGVSANPPNTSNANNPPVVSTSPAAQPASMAGMLESHNRVRAAVGVAPLTWSSTMTGYAQEWATYLANQNNCQMQHRSVAGIDPLKAGENLYWASPLTRTYSDGRKETSVQAITPSQVADAWASEQADYDYASNRCASGKICGHYTQMVWRTTLEVGCGMAVCPDKGQIWVCSYNPPGNWVGEKPY